MPLLVVAYPKLTNKDYEFIQNYRAKYDTLYYDVVAPHFTIVFPISNISQSSFIQEIELLAEHNKKIDFSLKAAVVNKDAFDDIYHEFLIPDQGNSQIIKLHDRLYSDKLLKNLRLDIDFIPHISIGNTPNPNAAKSRVDHVNQSNIDIKGSIKVLDVISYENNIVKTLSKIALK